MIVRLNKINIVILVFAAAIFVSSEAIAITKRKPRRRTAKKVDVLLTENEAIKFIFPQAKEIKTETIQVNNESWLQIIKNVQREKRIKILKDIKSEIEYYTAYDNKGTITHYGLIDVVKGKWGPITYIIGVSTDAKIKDLAVMNYSERRGRPIKNRKFLDQFFGKDLSDKLKVARNIDGITGATISSRGITDGINKVLCLFENFILPSREQYNIDH